MRVLVTGGAGFVGHAILAALVRRGDEVVALVRDPDGAAATAPPDVGLVRSDLADAVALTAVMGGVDAVIHAAGSYRLGIAPSERAAMWDANVGTTTRVLDAAMSAGVGRTVYVSTCNVYGDTHGAVVDESYRRDPAAGFLSWYDETKFRAHEVAEARIAAGGRIVVAMPSGVYGPGDRFSLGQQLRDAFHGRLRTMVFPDAGLSWVHVDDLAGGIVAALDRGRIGESYNLAGPAQRVGEAVAVAARLGGHRPPRLTVPVSALRVIAPVRRRVPIPGVPADLDEVIRASDGVTYWADASKAQRELGFVARALETGLRDWLVDAGAA